MERYLRLIKVTIFLTLENLNYNLIRNDSVDAYIRRGGGYRR